MIDYQRFLDEVGDLDFVADEEKADHAIKAVVGVLASRMEESEARQLCEQLPAPLSFERLRSHQVRPTDLSTREYFGEIARQFDIDTEQAMRLVHRVLDVTKESLDEKTLHLLAAQLPADWGALLEVT